MTRPRDYGVVSSDGNIRTKTCLQKLGIEFQQVNRMTFEEMIVSMLMQHKLTKLQK